MTSGLVRTFAVLYIAEFDVGICWRVGWKLGMDASKGLWGVELIGGGVG